MDTIGVNRPKRGQGAPNPRGLLVAILPARRQVGRLLGVNFGMLGVGGFVAPRHLTAIHSNGHRLVAACDPFDSVGVLDHHFPEARFFTEIERFDRFLEKQRRERPEERVHWLSVCSPNYLHDAHVRLALRVGANAICEKPLVINPWNLDQLEAVEHECEGTIYTVLQLRLVDSLRALKQQLKESNRRASVTLTYVTRRGRWYGVSWKGQTEKSGGLVTNIGIHLFDLLLWLFGPVEKQAVHRRDPDRAAGFLQLERADVRWFLSTAEEDLPESVRAAGHHAHRVLNIDQHSVDFTQGFNGLHNALYAETLAGNGFRIADARPSIELAYRIRNAEVDAGFGERHPDCP